MAEYYHDLEGIVMVSGPSNSVLVSLECDWQL